MLAFAYMVHFFPNKLAGLGRRSLSFLLIAAGAL
jgi:hypothetical protein